VSSNDSFSASQSSIAGVKPFERQLSASNKDHVGGSIAEYTAAKS